MNKFKTTIHKNSMPIYKGLSILMLMVTLSGCGGCRGSKGNNPSNTFSGKDNQTTETTNTKNHEPNIYEGLELGGGDTPVTIPKEYSDNKNPNNPSTQDSGSEIANTKTSNVPIKSPEINIEPLITLQYPEVQHLVDDVQKLYPNDNPIIILNNLTKTLIKIDDYNTNVSTSVYEISKILRVFTGNNKNTLYNRIMRIKYIKGHSKRPSDQDSAKLQFGNQAMHAISLLNNILHALRKQHTIK